MVPKNFKNIDEEIPTDTRSMLIDAAYLDGKRDAFNEIRENIIEWVKYFDTPIPDNLNDKLRWIINQEIRSFLMKLFNIEEQELGK